MSQQYFAREPQSASRPASCRIAFQGRELDFTTDAGVFSRGELDKGTALLLAHLPPLSGRVLDLGCGWGAIGVCLQKAFPQLRVTMVDVNLRALELARENARRNGVQVETLESDGLDALAGRRFDYVVTNPPIRAGKETVYRLLDQAAQSLERDGGLCLVIRKQQGAESCIKHLQSRFAQVETRKKSGGFWVLCARGPIEGK